MNDFHLMIRCVSLYKKQAPHMQVLSRYIYIYIYIYIYYTPSLLTEHFPITRSVRYQPIFHTLYFTLQHCAHVLNTVVLTTIIEMAEMVEILDGRVGQYSVERVRYQRVRLYSLCRVGTCRITH